MEDNTKDVADNSQDNSVSFLKVDALRRGSYAFGLLLERTDDIIVGVDKIPFRENPKTFK